MIQIETNIYCKEIMWLFYDRFRYPEYPIQQCFFILPLFGIGIAPEF